LLLLVSLMLVLVQMILQQVSDSLRLYRPRVALLSSPLTGSGS
jgi:hypothetical protein